MLSIRGSSARILQLLVGTVALLALGMPIAPAQSFRGLQTSGLFEEETQHAILVDGLPVMRGRLLYLCQGPEVPGWLQDIVSWPDVAAIFLSFARELGEVAHINRTIFLPNSTLTQGRNALYAESHEFQASLGWSFEYLVLTDDDMLFKSERPLQTDLLQLHDALLRARPAVGAVFGCPPNGETVCGAAIDANWNAYHATAAPLYLPYYTVFDNSSWWMSQAVVQVLLAETAPEHVACFGMFKFDWQGSAHRPYPRGLNLTEAVRYLASARSGTSSCVRDKIAGTIGKSDLTLKQTECASSVNASLALDYRDIIQCHPFGP